MKKQLICLSLTIICLILITCCVSAKPYLVESSWGINKTPSEIVGNNEFIETLPFDGLEINGSTGQYLMTPNFNIGGRVGRAGIADGVWTYEQCIGAFEPITTTKPCQYYFKKLTHNFTRVKMQPVGFFEDWSWIIASFKNYAKVCKDLGFKGIVLDDEINKRNPTFWNYGDTAIAKTNPYYLPYSLEASHAQARLRGKQIMEAMISEYPGIVVVVLHTPYNDSKESYTNDLMLYGSFIGGFVEASAAQPTHSLVVDGDITDFRDMKDFQNSLKMRLYYISDQKATPPIKFMDDKLRSIWLKNYSVSFSLFNNEGYDKNKNNFKPITDMTIVRNTVANALLVAADYVWNYIPLYDESYDPDTPQTEGYLAPMPKGWIEAIRLARQETARQIVD